ncbi:hypothetical protein DERP_006862 [Dermatophagoides pteronyssinus]|nr:hypothetical protein DERP_006862 [Dermatophagoides pteronyssinus]
MAISEFNSFRINMVDGRNYNGEYWNPILDQHQSKKNSQHLNDFPVDHYSQSNLINSFTPIHSVDHYQPSLTIIPESYPIPIKISLLPGPNIPLKSESYNYPRKHHPYIPCELLTQRLNEILKPQWRLRCSNHYHQQQVKDLEWQEKKNYNNENSGHNMNHWNGYFVDPTPIVYDEQHYHHIEQYMPKSSKAKSMMIMNPSAMYSKENDLNYSLGSESIAIEMFKHNDGYTIQPKNHNHHQKYHHQQQYPYSGKSNYENESIMNNKHLHHINDKQPKNHYYHKSRTINDDGHNNNNNNDNHIDDHTTTTTTNQNSDNHDHYMNNNNNNNWNESQGYYNNFNKYTNVDHNDYRYYYYHHDNHSHNNNSHHHHRNITESTIMSIMTPTTTTMIPIMANTTVIPTSMMKRMPERQLMTNFLNNNNHSYCILRKNITTTTTTDNSNNNNETILNSST